jgi:hypothetical protein
MYMVTPLSALAKEWVSKNVNIEDWQWNGSSFAVEHRYIDNLVAGMRSEDLSVAESSR